MTINKDKSTLKPFSMKYSDANKLLNVKMISILKIFLHLKEELLRLNFSTCFRPFDEVCSLLQSLNLHFFAIFWPCFICFWWDLQFLWSYDEIFGFFSRSFNKIHIFFTISWWNLIVSGDLLTRLVDFMAFWWTFSFKIFFFF